MIDRDIVCTSWFVIQASRTRRGASMTKVTSDREAVLAGITYLRALPPADLRRLAAHAVVRDFRRGARIFEEGAAANGLFVVVEGRVRLIRRSRGGREQVLHAEG